MEYKDRITPMKAIRKKCLDRCCNHEHEIKACSSLDCPIWMFRLGLHPFTPLNYINPFLRKDNFKELHNLSASEVITIINNKK